MLYKEKKIVIPLHTDFSKNSKIFISSVIFFNSKESNLSSINLTNNLSRSFKIFSNE